MQIIRDASWDSMLKEAMAHYRTHDVTDKCIQLANATWRCVTKARELRAKKMSRGMCLLDATTHSHKRKVVQSVVFCQGKTKSGERCRFKASCDGFCKKHVL